MTLVKFLTTSFIAAIAFVAFTGDANAQYAPGFQFSQTRISPFGGIANVNESIQPYWGGTQSYQSNYFNPWTGVSFGRQAVSNSYGTQVVTQSFNPYYGPTYSYQYAPAPVINPQIAFYLGRPVVYNNQMAAYYGNRYRPGFTWNGW